MQCVPAFSVFKHCRPTQQVGTFNKQTSKNKKISLQNENNILTTNQKDAHALHGTAFSPVPTDNSSLDGSLPVKAT